MQKKNNASPKQKKKSKNKISPKTLIAAAVCIFAVVFIGSQAYVIGESKQITTEITVRDTVQKTIAAKMFAVRDEQVISYEGGGNIVSAVHDGTRVAKDETVAYSLPDSASAGSIMRMREIKDELEYYSELQKKSASVANDTSSYENRITEDLCAFGKMIASGNFTNKETVKDELRDAVTAKQTATGTELDLSQAVAALENEYNTLASTVSGYSEVKAQGTGYYISGSDGYETALDYEKADSWTPSEVENALNGQPQTVSKNAVGRIVHGYFWYLATVVDTNKINGLKEGSVKTIVFPDSSIDNLKATVYSIRSDGETGKSAVVFKCTVMNEDLALLRTQQALIVMEEYTGCRIDNNAVRVNEENKTGVYVVSGSQLEFKYINIVYSGKDYSIVLPYGTETNEDGSETRITKGYIKVFDEYVVSGNDIYDGKIIR